MKYLLVILIVLMLASCSETMDSNEKGNLLKGKVTLEENSGTSKAEVFLYEKQYRTKEEHLIKSVKVEDDGTFSMVLPKEYNDFIVHIAAPNYYTYQTPILNHEKEIRIDATLQPLCIPEDFKAVYIRGAFHNTRQKEVLLTKDESGKYVLDEEFEKDTVIYQLNIPGHSRLLSYPAENEQYVYDHRGTYKNMIFPKNGKYRFELDMSKYRTIPKEGEAVKSTASFSNAPENDKYIKIHNEFGNNALLILKRRYEEFVQKINNESLKEMTEDEITNITQRTLKEYKSKMAFADSMLQETDNQYLRDYLACNKIIMLSFKEKKDTAQMNQMLDKLYSIPYDCKVLFSVFDDDTIFNKNSLARMEELEQKVMNLKNRSYIPDMLYQVYNLIEHKDKNVELYYRKVKSIQDNYELTGYLKHKVNSEINRFKLKEMTEAPDFEFTTFKGEKKKLSDYRGKWVLLDFWSTWCAPCIAETPNLKENYNEYKEKGFEIISLSADKSAKSPKDYVKEHKMNWVHTVLLEGYAKGVGEKYAVNAYPSLFLINPEGKFIHMDKKELRGESLNKTLAKYIDGEDVSKK